MTRYSELWSMDDHERITYYQEGVDRVVTYIESIHRYDTLIAELRWAIKE